MNISTIPDFGIEFVHDSSRSWFSFIDSHALFVKQSRQCGCLRCQRVAACLCDLWLRAGLPGCVVLEHCLSGTRTVAPVPCGQHQRSATWGSRHTGIHWGELQCRTTPASAQKHKRQTYVYVSQCICISVVSSVLTKPQSAQKVKAALAESFTIILPNATIGEPKM